MQFRDITALQPNVVAGLDARGFILVAVVAYQLNVGFVPIYKKGKLPFATVQETMDWNTAVPLSNCIPMRLTPATECC